jgi:hypothetical protein
MYGRRKKKKPKQSSFVWRERREILSDAILDASYYICEEFGPVRSIPRGERLKKRFPHLTTSDLLGLLHHVDAVSKTVWSLAARGGVMRMKKHEIIAELQRNHPFLRQEGLARAIFLVNYFAN